jgi:transposase
VDALGNPTSFMLTPGQAHDLNGADGLLPALEADALLADKAYDADDRVLGFLQKTGKTAVIPPKRNRKAQRDYDKDLYGARHLIENFFCKLKQYRAIATRYDKTACNFLAAVYLASAIVWLN